MNRRGRGSLLLAVLALIAVIVVPGTGPAAAAWQVSVPVPSFTLSAGSLTAPAATCQTTTSSPPAARISWPAVDGATGYRVVLANTVTSSTAELAANQPETSYDVTGSTLSNLLLVLGSLLTGGSVYVTVTALNQGWISPPSSRQNIVLAGSLLSGLAGGLKCQSA
ncbi:hypothetical protein B0I12_001809 [Microbacterium hydrothermale]|uniref:hypothetical protein n=1 Tax=Microbacterium hydrothermale TaxID=857427 RepID=UPI002227E9BA|nr:hypothetical protein [Microbacterium hydrothermale]MCW2164674.1 hypothetical protein [Microbacterium hydrothermale]